MAASVAAGVPYRARRGRQPREASVKRKVHTGCRPARAPGWRAAMCHFRSATRRTHHFRTLRVSFLPGEGTRRISTLHRAELDALYPGLLDGVLAGER